MSTEHDTQPTIPRVTTKKKKAAGKCPSQAVRPSERARFVAQELLKLRRMTLGQIARLCRLSTTYFARELMKRGCDQNRAWALAEGYPDDVLGRFVSDERSAGLSSAAGCDALLRTVSVNRSSTSFEESTIAPHVQSARDMLRRLVALRLIRRESATVGLRQRSIYMLTEEGYRQACASSGRHPNLYRDHVEVEFLAHLLMTTDFYLDFLTTGARDWAEVRRRSSTFEWFASNERTRFQWDAPGREQQRRVDPDATIETDSHRFLIEIERSTKSLPVVKAKFETYNRLFSRVASRSTTSGYRQKFGDTKQPSVVFVFATADRAKNAQAVADRMRASEGAGWQIPELHIGTVESAARGLRQLVLTGKQHALIPPPLPAQYEAADVDLIRRHVSETWRLIEQVQQAAAAGVVLHKPAMPATLGAMNKLVAQLTRRSGA